MSLQFSPISSPAPVPLVPSRKHSLLRRTPPSHAIGLPAPRARAASVHSSNGTSKSAPVSPNIRASPANGLAPLSVISPVALSHVLPESRNGPRHESFRPGLARRSSAGNTVTQEAESSKAADARARAAQMEQAQRMHFMAQQQALFLQSQQSQHSSANGHQPRIQPSQPVASHYLPRKSPSGYHASAQHAAYPFPPQTRARSRPRPDPSMSSSESEYDSDVTAVPLGRTSANSKSQPDLVALRREVAHGWAAQQAAESGRDRERARQNQTNVRAPSAGQVPANGPPTSSFRPKPITIPSNNIRTGSQSGPSPGIRTKPIMSLSPLQSTADLARSGSPLPSPGSSSSPRSSTISALARSHLSKSQPSLFALRESAPRNFAANSSAGQSLNGASVSLDSSPENRRRRSVAYTGDSATSGGENDADDDWEATSTSSPSSGSLTFSPKRVNGLRHRPKSLEMSALGLMGVERRSFGDSDITTETETEGEHGTSWGRREKLSIQAAQGFNVASAYAYTNSRPSSLLFFRLLAVVPSWWGILVLIDGARQKGLWADVWPWGVDLSRDAWNVRLGEDVNLGGQPTSLDWRQGKHTWEKAPRGELLIAILWALLTSQFCFSLTTGLTHRWRSYYSLPSTVTRLMSLQCLCWPATYATLRILGAKRPLLAWVVIGVTTGWSRAVQMFVTSNVVEGNTVVTNTAATSTFGSASTTPAGHGHGVPLPSPRERLGPPPLGCSDWEAFLWGRKWDWDKVSRKVIGKVALLFLITTAWLFWVEENGGRMRYTCDADSGSGGC